MLNSVIFIIEAGSTLGAIVSVPPNSGINQQTKPSWPWDCSGRDALVPSIDGEMAGEPVDRLRVRRTKDLELVYEIVQPIGTRRQFIDGELGDIHDDAFHVDAFQPRGCQ